MHFLHITVISTLLGTKILVLCFQTSSTSVHLLE